MSSHQSVSRGYESPPSSELGWRLKGGDVVVVTGSGWLRTVSWQDPTVLGSAAFWVDQTRRRPRPTTYQVGSTLVQEVALCLLGGYGITEQMAYAAYSRLLDEGLLGATGWPTEAYAGALSRPFQLPGRASPVRYRFPQQKAQRLSSTMHLLAANPPPEEWEPRQLREWLTTLPGVGPKTASWIVRNRTRSDDIAVIDIHVRRAGLAAGFFDPTWRLPSDYALFEEAFVQWARIGDVATADLDACIWSSLAQLGRGARTLFGVERLADLDSGHVPHLDQAGASRP